MKHWLIEYSEKVNKDLSSIEVHFLDNVDYNSFLNNLIDFPHAYVLACCMDRRIKADRAWNIPCVVKERLCGTFLIDDLAQIPLSQYKAFFNENSLHIYNNDMAEIFYKAIHRIKEEYNGDASRIWSGKPSSAAVVYRFLQFEGVGLKIATMATNILARQFKIPFSDYYSIDVSPDVHIQRIFKRTRLVSDNASKDEIVYKARELNPEYPGIVDAACWKIGREYCHSLNPSCGTCPIAEHCCYDAAETIDEALFDAAK